MDFRASLGKTVVIVDDDEALLNALGFSLETEGYQVRCHPSVTDFLRSARPWEASVLIIDQHLPDGAGLDLIALVQEAGILAPAILVTTNPSRSVQARAQELHVTLIEKPLLGDTLFSEVHRLSDL